MLPLQGIQFTNIIEHLGAQECLPSNFWLPPSFHRNLQVLTLGDTLGKSSLAFRCPMISL